MCVCVCVCAHILVPHRSKLNSGKVNISASQHGLKDECVESERVPKNLVELQV